MMANWRNVKVGDFLFEREGKYKPDSTEVCNLKRVAKIDFSGRFHISTKPSKTNMIRIESGDLVISGINVAKGALGIYEGNDAVAATIHYSSYSFDEDKINVEYFKRFLKSSLFLSLLREQVKGGIKTEIKPKHLLPLVIPLPDIAEQENILARFLKIENEDRALKQELAHQQVLTKKLRQRILQEAIEGKLTIDWRSQNLDAEPASVLLERIAEEKVNLIKAKKIKKSKVLPQITDDEKPFALPEGWEWCRLGEATYGFQYGTSSKSSKSGDAPVLRMGNLQNGNIDWTDLVFSSDQEDIGKFDLLDGDLLFNRTNSRELVGKTALFKGERKAIYAGYLVRFHMAGGVSAKYANVVMNSLLHREWCDEVKTDALGQSNINATKLSFFRFPMPPIPEQEVIAEKVEQLLVICDQLETQNKKSRDHADELMQAVLREVFTKGEEFVQSIEVERNNIVSLKPTQVDFYKRTLLAAEIVDQLHTEPTLGHLKLQKLIFLCQKTQDMQLPTNFLQQAAGPYDPKMARSIDKQLRDKKWFEYRKSELHKYQPLDEAGSHKSDFEKYFADDLSAISRIISLFRRARSEEMEAVATLYACWEELLKSGNEISNDLLTNKFYAWSEQKSRFPVEKLEKTISWMTDKGIVPRTSVSEELVQ